MEDVVYIVEEVDYYNGQPNSGILEVFSNYGGAYDYAMELARKHDRLLFETGLNKYDKKLKNTIVVKHADYAVEYMIWEFPVREN
jgi:hypothetical protein